LGEEMKKQALAVLTAFVVASTLTAAPGANAAGFKGGYVCHKGKKTLYFERNERGAYRAHLDHGDRRGRCGANQNQTLQQNQQQAGPGNQSQSAKQSQRAVQVGR
jgi:hypothetical protein